VAGKVSDKSAMLKANIDALGFFINRHPLKKMCSPNKIKQPRREWVELPYQNSQHSY